MSKIIRKPNIVKAFKNSFDLRSSSAFLTDINVQTVIAKNFIMLSKNRENLTINIDMIYEKEKYHILTKYISVLENNIFLSYSHKFNNIYYNEHDQSFEKDIEEVLNKVEEYYRYNKRYESEDFFIKNISIYFEKYTNSQAVIPFKKLVK